MLFIIRHMNYYKRPLWQNRIFIFLFLILIITILFVYWSITRPNTTNKVATETKQQTIPTIDIKPRITNQTGNSIKIGKNTQEEPINLTTTIDFGDKIKTAEDSTLTISFGKIGFIRVDEKSEIQILETNENIITIRQIQGNVYHRMDNDNISYGIESGDLTISSKKTLFNLSINKDSTFSLDIIEGNPEVNVKKGGVPITQVTISAGSQNIIDPKKSLKSIITTKPFDYETILTENKWLAFNIEEDKKQDLSIGVFKNNGIPSEIILNAYIEKKKVNLDWKLVDGQATYGYRSLLSKEREEPIYPEDTYHTIRDASATSDVWKDLSAGDYFFRIGVYDGKGTILKYSNSVKITVQATNTPLGKITLEIEKTFETGVQFMWKTENLQQIDSFYLIQSASQNPRYPQDNFREYDAHTSVGVWDGLQPTQTYYFRVCAVINKNCILYSEPISMTPLPSITTSNGTISLLGNLTGESIYLEWSTENLLTNGLGYRILLSKYPEPTEENSTIKTISSRNTNFYTWNNISPATYYIKVCEYLGDNKCGITSNIISMTLERKDATLPKESIKLNAYYTWGKLHATWEPTNLKNIDGYYILVSETPEPTYPSAPYHNISAETFYDVWTVESGKTYYVRGCAFKQRICSIYSNELQVKTL